MSFTLPPGPMFNFAVQAWNHQFFGQCLDVRGGDDPVGELARGITLDFGSPRALRQRRARS